VTASAPVLLASGYAVALLVGALTLDLLAQHTHRRSERFRTAGFRYHPQHDAWICPQDQYLWPYEYDAERRLIRYRAKPSVCNACPVKSGCTGSNDGREMIRPLDAWPHSEAGRFHRGLALVLVVLAGLFVLTAIVAARSVVDATVLVFVFTLVGLVGWRLTAHFRQTPANFPAVRPAADVRPTDRPSTYTTPIRGTPVAEPRWWSYRRRDTSRIEEI
jgi:hypothetical protein